MKNINYNYAWVFYDVSEKRVNKVFKICKKYLSHFQKSVFRGDITPSKLISLRSELKNIIVEKEDFVCILKLYGFIIPYFYKYYKYFLCIFPKQYSEKIFKLSKI